MEGIEANGRSGKKRAGHMGKKRLGDDDDFYSFSSRKLGHVRTYNWREIVSVEGGDLF